MQSLAAMLSQFDATTLALVALAAFSTALFHSVAGFAGALLLSVCLAPLIGVRAVVPVVSLAMIISNANRIVLFRDQVDWRAYRAIIMTGLPCMLTGAVIYLYLPVKAIAIVMGFFLLVSIPLRRILKQRNYHIGYRGLSVVAIIYGLIAGTVFGGGMILGPFFLGAGIVGQGLVGLVAALGLTLNVAKSAVFGLGSLLDSELVALGLVAGICTIPGGMLGKWIVKNTDIEVHTVIVETLMAGGGCYFLYQGFYL